MATGRLKRGILVAGGVLVVGALILGVLTLRAYHEATKIDRSVPKIVVRNYIDAFLVRRDDQRVALFTCSDGSALESIISLREQLVREETAGDVTTRVVLTRSTELDGGRRVDVELQLNQGSGLQTDRRTQHWLFRMVDEDGWRVCGAEQLPDPSPSPSASPSATPPTAG
ncbi:hypothetical protein HDA40_004775 [Hamadaea flava]|uniref:Mce-associated membrane protein n=1 Tax=Hamadaea flava TaxID=1742688 RepID=A0ABV8LFM2_9ACTN|nr:hypothetical protein [Hamadaea flava]MCP2326268.1 hypothetical protein [Hamadaea flava]